MARWKAGLLGVAVTFGAIAGLIGGAWLLAWLGPVAFIPVFVGLVAWWGWRNGISAWGPKS